MRSLVAPSRLQANFSPATIATIRSLIKTNPQSFQKIIEKQLGERGDSFVDALSGSAANLMGDITPGSVYAHIDQSLGGWEQRPVFKTNVKNFISMRRSAPKISLEELRKIPTFFPRPGFEFHLNPTFEPEMKGRSEGMAAPIKENTEVFAILQKYNRLNLLLPVGAEHMWHAAMESKACRLTALGEHYRKLCAKGRI